MPHLAETEIRNSITPLPRSAALGIAVSERAFERLEGESARLLEPAP